MNTEILRNIGLSDNEIRVYLDLLKHSDSLASDIGKRTSINRTVVYQSLAELISKGLIAYVIKNNTKYFKAAPPAKLVDYLKEKETNLQSLLPELISIKKTNSKPYSVELYEGKEGLKTILNDILKDSDRKIWDWTSGYANIILPKLYIEKWHQKRIHKKIFAHFLVNNTPLGRIRGEELAKKGLSDVRYTPAGLTSPAHIFIYAQKVAILLYVEEYPFGILIENNDICDKFREFFEWIWKLSSEKP